MRYGAPQIRIVTIIAQANDPNERVGCLCLFIEEKRPGVLRILSF